MESFMFTVLEVLPFQIERVLNFVSVFSLKIASTTCYKAFTQTLDQI